MFSALRTVVMGLVVIGCLAVSGSVGDDQPTRAGWWVRIDADRCEATSITFRVGVSAKESDAWFTWNKGDPTEFELPEQLRDKRRVYLHARANPDDHEASFCVYYKDHAVEHFDFDGAESETMKNTDRDDDCR